MGSYDPTDFESVKAAMARYETIKLLTLFTFLPTVFVSFFMGWAELFIVLMLISIPTLIVIFWAWWLYLLGAPALRCDDCGHGLMGFLSNPPPPSVCRNCGLKASTAAHGKTVAKPRMLEVKAQNTKAEKAAWLTGLTLVGLLIVLVALPFDWAPVLALPFFVLALMGFAIVRSMFIDPNEEHHDH